MRTEHTLSDQDSQSGLMQPLFLRLFAYDLWASRRAYASLAELREPPAKAVEWLGHIVLSQRFVFEVLNGRDASLMTELPEPPLKECSEWIERLGADWRSHLMARTEEDLAGEIEFRNSRGVMDKRRVADLLIHAVTHSTYHRGQIALAVREAGGEPAGTDFTIFMREQHP